MAASKVLGEESVKEAERDDRVPLLGTLVEGML